MTVAVARAKPMARLPRDLLGSLIVFPSVNSEDDLLGVKYNYVGGTYESRINQIEAKEVLETAVGLMCSRPELSIGVATMNVEQRQLIFQEFEREAAENEDVRRYIEARAGTIEPFFVKNLENVQGDERDVIIISTLYGPDPNGHVYQRFGPINSPVGHRRLNVLFTRAKRATILITSLRPSDIRITEQSHAGVQALQAYLTYAADGPQIDTQGRIGGEPDSDFEVFGANRLRDAGYEVVPQVGVDKFRIDIGVRHPDSPQLFVAGIE